LQKLTSRFPNLRVRTIDTIKNSLSIKNKLSFNVLSSSDACFLVGIQIKTEAPILQIRLRAQFLKGNFLVSSIGPMFKNTIPTNFFGLTMKSFFSLLEGKINMQQAISSFKLPLFFVGKNFYNRLNDFFLEAELKKLNMSSKIFYIDSAQNQKANNFFGFIPLNKKDLNWADIILFLNVEESFVIKSLLLEKKIIVWINSHGSKIAEKANIILPTTTPFEHSYSYLNAEGREQKTEKVLPSTANAANVANIIQLIFSQVGHQNFSLKELISIYNINYKAKSQKFNNILESKNISPLILSTVYPIKSNLEDFYLNRKIAQSSAIMGQSSQIFRADFTNF